ncbi:MAG TPA: NAD(+) kinase [Piscirickettsiaceae bacterium]|nr:NAD(+) kinase [Piscirickettsiaceae bacterium]HIQ39795.1 NAD(+) kinase [Sulfurivirga caldicuralii]
MSTQFKRVGLFGKPNALEAWDTIGRVIDFLRQQGCAVALETECCVDFPHARYGAKPMPRAKLCEQIDLGIAIGGDGTFLNAARDVVGCQVPLLGINLGRLGFLADFSPDKLEETLRAVLEGDYIREARTLLQVRIFEEKQEVFRQLALNDVVVHKRDTPRMIEFNTFVDDHFMMRQRSDGLIIATPTGSTAYALSAGGPILDPRVDALVLVSINPHTLSNRPVVIPASSMVKVIPHKNCTGSAKVICDGQVTFEIQPWHITQVAQFEQKLTILHPRDYNYYDILRTKLAWGGHNRC